MNTSRICPEGWNQVHAVCGGGGDRGVFSFDDVDWGAVWDPPFSLWYGWQGTKKADFSSPFLFFLRWSLDSQRNGPRGSDFPEPMTPSWQPGVQS